MKKESDLVKKLVRIELTKKEHDLLEDIAKLNKRSKQGEVSIILKNYLYKHKEDVEALKR